MKLIITEKPSVAKNIAEALGNSTRHDGFIETPNYLITWAFGHLLTLWDAKDYNKEMAAWKMDNFPFIPETFQYKVKTNPKNRDQADSGAKKQLEIIKNLIKRSDVTHVVSATDFDREGQIIGDIILNYLKVSKPVERLLLNEWTPEVVRSGLNNLKDNSKMKNVSDAGICRQWTDWIIGINLTSATSIAFNKGTRGPINIGRVLLPTLKIIYDRDKEIENFKAEEFFKLTGKFTTHRNEVYEGIYQYSGKDKFSNKDSIKKIQGKMKNVSGKVANWEKSHKKEYAPQLFNLSELQGHITSSFSGWTSSKVLKVAQSLYEKKHITYPRTASSVLEETLVERAERVLNTLKKGLPYERELKFSKNPRVFNNKKVEGHSAIIPTYIVPQSLTPDESIVYKAIVDRFIMQFLPVHEFEETVLKTVVENVVGEFITKGKTITVLGWKILQSTNNKEVALPTVTLGERVEVEKGSVSSHKTTPPKFHTEKSLLRVMENCGRAYNSTDDESEIMNEVLNGFSIGTPATRAETISKLIATGYINTKGKNLFTTELGQSLVEKFPVQELFNLEYTGKLEKTLSDIELGKVQKDDFMKYISNFTQKSIEQIKLYKGGINLMSQENVSLGRCPLCGSDVVETERNFGCTGWKNGCKYSIWKNDRFLAAIGTKPDAKMVQTILNDGKVLKTNLTSKKGTKYDAYLSLTKNEETGYMNWNMDFPPKK